jgi:hypothetical protein
MKKTFKIGEYVVGGIIEVETQKESIIINFRDYFSKEIVLTKTFPFNNNIIREIQFFIEENGTCYYADKVTQYIKDKVKLPEPSSWYGW